MEYAEALEQLRAAGELAARRGSLMFHLDLATELARVALEAEGVPTDALAPLAGADGYRVVALDLGAPTRALATVSFNPRGAAVVRRGTKEPLAFAEAVARARQMVARAFPELAPILIPSATAAVLDGYAIATRNADTIMLAGHWFATVADEGRRLSYCEPIVADRFAAPMGSIVVGTRGAIEVAGAAPNELHVYLSLKHGVPLHIRTPDSGLDWRVDGESVTIA